MELLIIMATIAVICRDPAGTIKAATSYKRAQIEKARLKGTTRSGQRPGHRAFRNYLGTVWEAQWEEAISRYPDKMRAAKARRAKRTAKRKAAWSKVEDTAERRWERRRADAERRRADAERPAEPESEPGVLPEPEAPEAAPETGPETTPEAAPELTGEPVPDGVIDLDEERRRRTADAPEAPRETPVPEAEPANEEEPMSLNLSDSASLRSHLAALNAHADYWDRTCTAKEQLAAGMREAGLGESTVAAVDASRAASAHAAAQARAAADALEAANMQVAEARAGSPDAADGDYYERR